MIETAERYAKVAAAFTDRVQQVPADAWEKPAPCAGWVARDIIRHIVDVSAYFLGRTAAGAPKGPPVDDDPAGAWAAARDAVLAGLNDPAVAGLEYDTPWDLARATGLDETLDLAEVHRLLTAMEPMDEMMRQGDAFGPKVEVPADADEQTRLIAFTGRNPF